MNKNKQLKIADIKDQLAMTTAKNAYLKSKQHIAPMLQTTHEYGFVSGFKAAQEYYNKQKEESNKGEE